MKQTNRTRLAAGMLAGGLVTAGVALAQPALAATGPETVPASDAVTGYAGYPANEVPNVACDATDVLGVEFTLNGGPPQASMGALGQLAVGDELGVTWSGNNPECGGVYVSVVLKAATSAVFDPSDEQELLTPYARRPLDGGPGQVTLDLPETPECFYQADAVLGRPLALVGDAANFYSGSLGLVARSDERSMLLGFNNGAQAGCGQEPTTTTTEATTTTGPPVTAPPTTQPPTTTTTARQPNCSELGLVDVPAGHPAYRAELDRDGDGFACDSEATSTPVSIGTGTRVTTTIPVTGPGATPWLAGTAALLLAAGSVLVGQGRRLTRRAR